MTAEEWEYTLPEKDKVYNFVFTPKTANGAEKVEECSRFVASNNDRYKLPRVVVETKDNVFPTSDWVISPIGLGGTSVNDEYVKSIVTLYSKDGDVLYSSIDGLEEEEYFDSSKIKVRGNTSSLADKKPYKIKLDKKYDLLKDLLGRDDSKHKNKNWNLLKSEAFSLNTIVGKAVGEYVGMEWQLALVLVDLFINGDYRGVYALIESIEDGEGRIDINDDGFIMERDAYYWSEDAYFVSNGNREFTFKYPEYESNEEIDSYIIDQVNGFEASLNYKDDRYKEYIDEKTFAAWVLGHDYLGTLDAAGSNMYIYKKDSSDDSKMKMGPMWDFDSNFQKIDELAGIHNSNYFMYKDLFKNYYFNQAYNELFNDTKEGITEHVVNELNKLDFEGLNSSREMEILRWGGTYSTVSEDVERIEDWFESRVQFLEKKIN